MLNSTIYTDNQSIINYNLFFQQNNFFIKKVIINILTIELTNFILSKYNNIK